MITVAIPVGPFEANKRWLQECLASIMAQTRQPDEVLLIDDMAGLVEADLEALRSEKDLVAYLGQPWTDMLLDRGIPGRFEGKSGYFRTFARVWRSPWRLGVAHAFNFGVAMARNDLVFLMGSDDTLEPDCLGRCLGEWEKNNKADGYYYTGIRYSDNDELQDLPCGYAMVTKGLWNKTGGFAVESAVGAPDAAFISMLMKNHPGSLIQVAGGKPLVTYRRHGESDTAGRGPWQGAILETRHVLTETWKEPKWTPK